MRFRSLVAVLFAASLAHGACSAQEGTGTSDPVANSVPMSASDTRTGPSMTQQRIVISSHLGRVTAQLEDNAAARTLVGMLPLTIEMRDHLRQEKTGGLPLPLPELQRRTEFSAGTLGLWGSEDFVIYYRNGRVPRPGIIVLGRVTGDVSIFDRPGPLTVSVERAGRASVRSWREADLKAFDARIAGGSNSGSGTRAEHLNKYQ